MVRVFGEGPSLVLVPGMQGRWEWMAPTVEALARSFRVATFSLCGEPGEPALGDDFDAHLAQIDRAIDALGGGPVLLVGVSMGGLIGLRYAARRPERVRGLVVASTPGPRFQMKPQHLRWMQRPALSFPAFVLTSPGRLMPEVRAATGGLAATARFFARHARNAWAAPMSATRTARRLRLALSLDFDEVAGHVAAPTLVVTGEDALDRVVPAASTREYVSRIRGARLARIERTGHLGTITRPDRFAALVAGFEESLADERSSVA